MLFDDVLDVAVTPYTQGPVKLTEDPTINEEFVKNIWGGDDAWRIVRGSRSRAYSTLA